MSTETVPLNLGNEPKTSAPPRSKIPERASYVTLSDGMQVRQSRLPPNFGHFEQGIILPALSKYDLNDYLRTPASRDPYKALNSNISENPLQNRLSQPMMGRIVPGEVDPRIVSAGTFDEFGRRTLKVAAQPVEMPKIPGVPGSGIEGLKERQLAQKHQGMGDGNTNVNVLQQLKQLVSAASPQVPLKEQGNVRSWRV